MFLTVTAENSIIVINVNGRLDSQSYVEFEKKAFEAIGEGNENVILDFSHVEFLTSLGMRSLLLIAKKMKATKRKIVLCSVNDATMEPLQITGFISFFPIYPNLDMALKANK